MPGLRLTYPSWLTSFFAFGIFLVWGAQHYWIRGASARSESAARNAFMLGALFLFIINLVIGFVGLFAGAFNGSVFTLTGGNLPTTAAYGATIAKFPAAAGVFLLVFALAASLSTCASVLMASVTIAAKDIYPLLKKTSPTDAETTKVSRIATILLSLIAWGLAYYPGGTAFLSAFATSWMAPAGLLFVMGLIWRRCTPTAAFVTAVIAIISASLYTLLDLFRIPIGGRVISGYFHLSVLLVFITIFFTVILTFVTKPKYYGRSDWKLQA
jgi:Na+/proline symporter